jgi:hypothetical protein
MIGWLHHLHGRGRATSSWAGAVERIQVRMTITARKGDHSLASGVNRCAPFAPLRRRLPLLEPLDRDLDGLKTPQHLFVAVFD